MAQQRGDTYTGKGLAALIREQFTLRLTGLALFCVLLANTGLVISEFAGIGAASELVRSLPPGVLPRLPRSALSVNSTSPTWRARLYVGLVEFMARRRIEVVEVGGLSVSSFVASAIDLCVSTPASHFRCP
jgi:hypothetical protein